MKVTSFKVDKSQPVGTLKVGNGWMFDNNRVLNEKNVHNYDWIHNEGALAGGATPVLSFDVIQIADAETLKVAFFAAKAADEDVGTFSVVDATGAAVEGVAVTAPVFEVKDAEGNVSAYGATKSKAGVITITPKDGEDTEFFLAYKAADAEDAVKLFKIRQTIARDSLDAPLVGGAYGRKANKWVADSE